MGSAKGAANEAKGAASGVGQKARPALYQLSCDCTSTVRQLPGACLLRLWSSMGCMLNCCRPALQVVRVCLLLLLSGCRLCPLTASRCRPRTQRLT